MGIYYLTYMLYLSIYVDRCFVFYVYIRNSSLSEVEMFFFLLQQIHKNNLGVYMKTYS